MRAIVIAVFAAAMVASVVQAQTALRVTGPMPAVNVP